MSRPPIYWKKAKRSLSAKDPVLKKIIKKYNKGFLTTRNNPFFSLCRTIVGQQISTKAADSIWVKFEKKCKNNISPKVVLKTPSHNLKKAGLSRQKVSYLKNIAKAFVNKSFDTKKLKKMNDDEAINYITNLKGLGTWSAEMFLMFNLNRPNSFPVKDIGLLRAISKKHNGYRTVFTWYMWRSIDPVDVEY